MPEVPITTFIDFVSKPAAAKLKVVEEFKGKYDPKEDFYKQIREGIVEMHQHDGEIKDLTAIARATTNIKMPHYRDVIDGYKRFVKGKDIKWFKPPTARWTHGDLTIRVNPELGLKIDGASYVIKLYFKESRLTKDGIAIITHLVRAAMPSTVDKGHVLCLLDTRRARLHEASGLDKNSAFILEQEAKYWMSIWNHQHRGQ